MICGHVKMTGKAKLKETKQKAIKEVVSNLEKKCQISTKTIKE